MNDNHHLLIPIFHCIFDLGEIESVIMIVFLNVFRLKMY
jgi:hypothetical protein